MHPLSNQKHAGGVYINEQDRKNDLAKQISKLQGDQMEAIEEFIREVSDRQNAQDTVLDKYLTFWCDEQLFGLCISQVMQIIQVPQIPPMEVVEKHVKESWICLYVKRWMETPFVTKERTVIERKSGTPQGRSHKPGAGKYVFALCI